MSKWPKSIILIRHGQSAYNLAKDEAKRSPSLALSYRTAGGTKILLSLLLVSSRRPSPASI
jgi:broad specificity phosphatase PhoE